MSKAFNFRCECGNDKFYMGGNDFAMCDKCGDVYRRSTLQKLEPIKHPGTVVKIGSINGEKIE